MDDTTFAPIARYLVRGEAWPMAGMLQSNGFDARVVREQASLAGYEHGGSLLSRFMVIVPERDAARALWIVEGIRDHPRA